VSLQPFEEVVAEHGPVVWRVCRALLGPVDADDAWSETFLAAMRAYPDLRPDSNVVGWLVTIAHRKAIDQLRRRARAPRPTDELTGAPRGGAPATALGATTDPDPTGATLDDELAAALATLTPKQRDAVLLHHVAGLPYVEVGAELGSSEAAARRSAADGIAKLRTTYPSPKGRLR
jgi:RNA polymerase sigma factor (sigma-70 family)